MITAAPTWTDRRFKAGYFDGLTAGWYQAGLITKGEVAELRQRMRRARPRWWNLAGWMGL